MAGYRTYCNASKNPTNNSGILDLIPAVSYILISIPAQTLVPA